MRPAEVILFMLLGFGALLFILVSWFLYYPTYREVTHGKRYEQLLIYLEDRYPREQFVIEPKVYELGYQVGDFLVRHADTSLAGVMLRVKEDGTVVQTSYWTNYGEPTQESLWRTLLTAQEMYSLDQKMSHVEKKDWWIDGEWTVFAVTMDARPALAFFSYDRGDYSSWPLVKASRGEVVSAEWQSRFFVYIDEAYTKETAIIE